MSTVLAAPLATPRPRAALAALAACVAVALLLPAAARAEHPVADSADDRVVVLAAEQRERRPLAPTPRAQLGLVLYGLMGLVVVGGGVTLRRQLRGERPQTDGEFRWR